MAILFLGGAQAPGPRPRPLAIIDELRLIRSPHEREFQSESETGDVAALLGDKDVPPLLGGG